MVKDLYLLLLCQGIRTLCDTLPEAGGRSLRGFIGWGFAAAYKAKKCLCVQKNIQGVAGSLQTRPDRSPV